MKKERENITTEIASELRALKLTPNKVYSYPCELAPYTINTIINKLNHSDDSNINILEGVNGCDLDWSLINNLKYEDTEYRVWGCIAEGTLVFQIVK